MSMRTTVDIDDPILREVKRLQKKEGKSLGRLVSDLLAVALDQVKSGKGDGRKRKVRWIAKPMGARVDLSDSDALYDAMEENRRKRPSRVAERRRKRR